MKLLLSIVQDKFVYWDKQNFFKIYNGGQIRIQHKKLL